jgi:hypothetical protein
MACSNVGGGDLGRPSESPSEFSASCGGLSFASKAGGRGLVAVVGKGKAGGGSSSVSGTSGGQSLPLAIESIRGGKSRGVASERDESDHKVD